jgi:hypothetical protein
MDSLIVQGFLYLKAKKSVFMAPNLMNLFGRFYEVYDVVMLVHIFFLN